MATELPKILLFGSTGQLGSHLLQALRSDANIVAPSRLECNIADPQAVSQIIRLSRPDVVLNAAGYTDVEQAESKLESAYELNAYAVRNLSIGAAASKSLLIHFSTDYVFDGSKTAAYDEHCLPNPINAYGSSKLAGESYVRESGVNCLILRTSWLHSATHPCFPQKILRQIRAGLPLIVNDDQTGTPTSAKLVSDITRLLVLKYLTSRQAGRGRFPFGTYHLSAHGETTWFDYAAEILTQARNLGEDLRQTTLSRRLTPQKGFALRPSNSVLQCTKIIDTFEIKLPDWQPDVLDTVRGLLRSSS